MITALLLIACPLAWSVLDLLRKYLAPYGKAVPLVLVMVLGQLPVFLVWAALEGAWQVESGYLLPALLSVVFNILANVAYMQSVQLSPMSATLPLLSLTPVFTTVLAVPLLGEIPRPIEWLGVVITVIGAFLLNSRREDGISLGGLWRSFAREKGSPYMAGVAICWSFAPIFDKQALAHAEVSFHAAFLSFGLAVFLTGFLAARSRLGEIRELGRARGLLVGVVATSVIALWLQLLAIQLVWVGLLETLKRALGSVLALAFGHLLFSEALPGRRVFAVVLMSVGVALVLL